MELDGARILIILEKTPVVAASKPSERSNDSMRPVRAYAELVEFIAANTAPAKLIAFRPSKETRSRVAELVGREKVGGLSRDEASELDHFVEIEHLMRLAKARARQQLAE
ncbi:MAG TPA: hypothetical protein VGO40_04525 [Longimicrobium sp.]|nr:hypothetical protein [Longimicrobium sp.]